MVKDLRPIRVVPVETIDARCVDRPWLWAEENRGRIDEHWRRLTHANPALYNGPVLVLRRQALRDGELALEYSQTDFATFIAFRDLGFPDAEAGNGFAMAALRAGDGAYLLGRMGEHTANPGKIYFPSGTPDPDDVRPDGTVDLAGSVLRELEEETGLAAADVDVTDRWTVVFAGARIAMMREIRVGGSAPAIQERVRRFLERQPRPELADLCIVRSVRDIDEDAMPSFMQAFLRSAFEAQR